MSLHKEISFKTEICEHLGASSCLYAQDNAAAYRLKVGLAHPARLQLLGGTGSS